MPPKRKIKKAKAKTKARKKTVPKSMIMIRNPKCPIPNTAYCIFKQRFAINILSAHAQSQGVFYVKANSCYHPFYAAAPATATAVLTNYTTTQSPAYYTMYCGAGGLYAEQRVYRSSLKVSSMGELNGGAIKICIAYNTGTGTYANYRTASESRYAKAKDFAVIYNKQTVTNTLGVHQMLAVPKDNVMTESDYVGQYDSDPLQNNQCQWAVHWQRSDGGNIASNCPIEMELTIYARLESPQEDNV